MLAENNPHLESKQLQNIKKDFKQFYLFLDELFNKQGVFVGSMDGLSQTLLSSYESNKVITMQSTDGATIFLHYKENSLKR